MSSGSSILLIFDFFLGILSKLFNVLDSFEFLPGISFLHFLIAIVLISVILKLLRFGVRVHDTELDDGNIYRTVTKTSRFGGSHLSTSKSSSSSKLIKKN